MTDTVPLVTSIGQQQVRGHVLNNQLDFTCDSFYVTSHVSLQSHRKTAQQQQHSYLRI